MKNDLSCAVTRDLLPSYVDALVSEETKAAVERHLENCADCRAQLDAMRAQETDAAAAEKEQREVDYLKSVRRRGRLRVAIAVLCTALVIGLALFAKIYLIGEKAAIDDLYYTVGTTGTDGGSCVTVSYSLKPYTQESMHYHLATRVVEKNGAWDITVRKVHNLPGRNTSVDDMLSSQVWESDVDAAGAVVLCGETVWQEGVAIDSSVREEFAAATEYVGDGPAVNELMQVFDPGFGAWTLELQTDTEPYGMTVVFSDALDAAQCAQIDASMGRTAEKLLALVGNLERVSWRYTDESGTEYTGTKTLEEVNGILPQAAELYNALNGTAWTAGESVKDYAADVYSYAQLCALLAMVH